MACRIFIVDLVTSAPAQALLRWATQQGIAVIPKSNSHERLVSNLDCNSFDLTADEIKKISSLNLHLRVSAYVSRAW